MILEKKKSCFFFTGKQLSINTNPNLILDLKHSQSLKIKMWFKREKNPNKQQNTKTQQLYALLIFRKACVLRIMFVFKTSVGIF